MLAAIFLVKNTIFSILKDIDYYIKNNNNHIKLLKKRHLF